MLILTQKMDRNDSILGFFHRWVEEFAKNCEKVIVICLYEGKHNLPENVQVLSLGKESGVSKLKYIFRFYKYIWQYRKDYENVFVHMNQIYVILSSFLWKFLGKKIGLWYAHGGISKSLKMAERRTNIVFTSTPSGFRLKSAKIRIVGQGIDANVFKADRNKRDKSIFKITTVGRISPIKDYETLIYSLETARTKLGNLKVDIIGEACTEDDKKYLLDLKKIISSYDLDGVVNFVGPLSNEEVVPYLQRSDLFVNMSHTGSLDKAILEAMACGLSVLTCNEALLALDLKNKDDLMFVKNDVKDLSDKILKNYLMSAEDRIKLEEYLSAFVSNTFSLDLLIAKIIKNYG